MMYLATCEWPPATPPDWALRQGGSRQLYFAMFGERGKLGCGTAPQNHVLLYKQLLARYGCDHWQDGPNEHFSGRLMYRIKSNGGYRTEAAAELSQTKYGRTVTRPVPQMMQGSQNV